MANLIKIDRNGSKHYEGWITCDRCNGRGFYAIGVHNGELVPAHPDNGVCYKCHGAGKVMGKWIERTPEYQAKLDAQRKARQEAKAAKLKAEANIRAEANANKWLTNNGFDAEGNTWILLGDTYSKKDQIKAAGGKFDPIIGWHMDHQVEDSFKMNVAELAKKLEGGWYEWTISRAEIDKIKKAQAGEPESQHSGEIGQKLTLTVKYVRSFTYEIRVHEGMWGTRDSYIHKFTDASGNIFVWKTGKPLERIENDEFVYIPEGTEVVLTGTVKEHNDYNGEKQTVLTRCKVN